MLPQLPATPLAIGTPLSGAGPGGDTPTRSGCHLHVSASQPPGLGRPGSVTAVWHARQHSLIPLAKHGVGAMQSDVYYC